MTYNINNSLSADPYEVLPQQANQAQQRYNTSQPHFFPPMAQPNQFMNQGISNNWANPRIPNQQINENLLLNQQQLPPSFPCQFFPPPPLTEQQQSPQFICPKSFTPFHPQYKYALWQTKCYCSHCFHKGVEVKYAIGSTVNLWGTLLFFLTGVFFWIPCCMDQCKDIKVHCNRCGNIKYYGITTCCGWC